MKRKTIITILSIICMIVIAIAFLSRTEKGQEVISRISSAIPLFTVSETQLVASEKEAVLPIKISYTDFEVNQKIKSIIEMRPEENKEHRPEDEKLAKIELQKKKIEQTTIKIIYEIDVTNVGEMSGIVDSVVVNTENQINISSESLLDWKKTENNKIVCDNYGTIDAGETIRKELAIEISASKASNVEKTSATILSSEDIDQRTIKKTNEQISVDEIDNDIKQTNNYDETEVIISISTGLKTYILIAIIILLILIIMGEVTYRYLKKRK